MTNLVKKILNYDSDEELYFSHWLDELQEHGIVIEYEYEPQPFTLSSELTTKWNKVMKTKLKEITKKIRTSLKYTVDFKITWNTSLSDTLLTHTDDGCYKKITNIPFYLPKGKSYSYVEIKPSFDQNNMTRSAKTKIAWVWQTHGEHVELIKPNSLFDKTFYPNEFLYTKKKGQLRTKKIGGVKTPLIDIVNQINDFIPNSGG